MKPCEIDITSIRIKKGQLRMVAGTLYVPNHGKCIFTIRKPKDKYFYELRVRDVELVRITNFENMTQLDWLDRSMVRWMGTYAESLITLAQEGTK